MESEGAVKSEWDTSGNGPARRRYRLTEGGEELLAGWAEVIERKAKAMGHFLEQFRDGWQKERI
jgi:DNA-binding PadR family transcriptional regulator